MRGFSWEHVCSALKAEITITNRLKSAEDLKIELAKFEELQATLFEDEPALWALDVGFAAATIALSGWALPVSSCNAGAFGGQHQARYPYVAFFLPKPWLRKFCSAPKRAMLVSYVMKMASFKSVVEEKWISPTSRKSRGAGTGCPIKDLAPGDHKLTWYVALSLRSRRKSRQLAIGCRSGERSEGNVPYSGN